MDIQGLNDCTEENLAVTFKNNGYRTAMVGKWHLSRFQDSTYNYDSARATVKGCGFDYVEALYIENLNSEGDFDNYSDGSFSHNQEWLTVEAINFINDQSSSLVSILFLIGICLSIISKLLKYSLIFSKQTNLLQS